MNLLESIINEGRSYRYNPDNDYTSQNYGNSVRDFNMARSKKFSRPLMDDAANFGQAPSLLSTQTINNTQTQPTQSNSLVPTSTISAKEYIPIQEPTPKTPGIQMSPEEVTNRTNALISQHNQNRNLNNEPLVVNGKILSSLVPTGSIRTNDVIPHINTTTTNPKEPIHTNSEELLRKQNEIIDRHNMYKNINTRNDPMVMDGKTQPWYRTTGGKVALAGGGVAATVGLGYLGWTYLKDYSTSQAANEDVNLVNSIASLDPNTQDYQSQIDTLSSQISTKGEDINGILSIINDAGLRDNANIKEVLIKANVPNIELMYPDVKIGEDGIAFIPEEDKGFLDVLGDKGKELYNVLTNGSTASNLTLLALAGASLAGAYYLYKKWKTRKLNKEDIQIAKDLDTPTQSVSESKIFVW